MKKLLLLLFILPACTPPGDQANVVDDAYPYELYDYDIEEKLKDLDIALIPPKLPKGVKIVTAVRSGNMVYLSGNTPKKADGSRITGKLGQDLTIEQGYEAARLSGINLLSALKQEIGDLNKVERIVKVLGMVNADPAFEDHPKVVNGFSELMLEVFGERGKHARSAVGMSSLPFNAACEIEMIVQVSP